MKPLKIEEVRLASMLKALSHPARLELFRTLSDREQQCIDLIREVELAQSVSEHLRILKEAGLIQECGPGPRAGYCVNREAVTWFKQTVIGL